MEKPEFTKLLDEFNKTNPGGWLRLGQWFMNRYDPLAFNPELFYCSDQKYAIGLIRDQYYK